MQHWKKNSSTLQTPRKSSTWGRTAPSWWSLSTSWMPCSLQNRRETQYRRTLQILKRAGSCSKPQTESTSSQTTDKLAWRTTSWSRETSVTRRLLILNQIPTLSPRVILSAWYSTKRRRVVKKMSWEVSSSSHSRKKKKLRGIKKPSKRRRGRRRPRNRYSSGEPTLCSSFRPFTFTSISWQIHSIRLQATHSNITEDSLSSMNVK